MNVSISNPEPAVKGGVDEKVKLFFHEIKYVIHCLVDLFVERLRRSKMYNNDLSGEAPEFHPDVPQLPIWPYGSMQPLSPIPVQLLPTHMNGSHTNIENFVNNRGDLLDRKCYVF